MPSLPPDAKIYSEQTADVFGALWRYYSDHALPRKKSGMPEILENINAALGKGDDAAPEKTAQLLGNFLTSGQTENSGLLAHILADYTQLNALADNLARHNYLHPDRQLNPDQKGITKEDGDRRMAGMANDLGKHHENRVPYETLVKALTQDVSLHQVITHHPTNVNSMERIEAMRDLKTAFAELRKDPEKNKEAFAQALKHFAQTKVTPEKNLSVEEETDFALHFLKQRYGILDTLYGNFETPLNKYKEHDPLHFHLPLDHSSWASGGDKDGNSSVKADSAFKAIQKHAHTVQALYNQDWKSIEATLGFNSDERIDAITAALALASQKAKDSRVPMVDTKALLTNLTALYEDTSINNGEAKTQILSLIRKVRTFGPCFGKIEYRENAREMTNIVDQLFSDLTDADLKAAGFITLTQKEYATLQKTYTNLLNTKLTDFKTTEEKENHKQKIKKAETALFPLKEKLYTAVLEGKIPVNRDENWLGDKIAKFMSENEAGIETTNLKRLEIALLNPEAIDNHVLAETKGVHHLLALELLKQGVSQKLSKDSQYQDIATSPNSLRTTPLFEDPDSLGNIKEVMDNILQNPEYKKALAAQHALRKERGGIYSSEQPMQEVKIAHSDTMRRSGSAVSRILIEKAHQDINQSAKDHGVNVLISQGNSMIAPDRGGMRAPSSQPKLYDLNHMKMTVQGLDNVVYSNGLSDVRLINRLLMDATERALAKDSTPVRSRKSPTPEQRDEVDQGIRDLLYKSTNGALKTYRNDFYEQKITGQLLAQLYDYHETSAFGNVTSRAANRGGKKVNPDDVDIENTRAISFTETFLHHKNFFTYPGASTLIDDVLKEANALKPQSMPNKTFAQVIDGIRKKTSTNGRPDQYAANSELLYTAYRSSRLFADMVDRAAYGMLSDFDFQWELMQQKRQQHKQQNTDKEQNFIIALNGKEIEGRPTPEQLEALAKDKDKSFAGMLAWMEMQYRDAAPKLYAAMTGKQLKSAQTMTSADIRKAFLDKPLHHFKEYTAQIDHAFPLIHSLEETVQKKQATTDEKAPEQEHLTGLRKILHLAKDTVLFFTPSITRDVNYLISFMRSKELWNDKHPLDAYLENRKSTAIGA